MAVTDPAGNPRSLPNWSLIYCDMVRPGSRAQADGAQKLQLIPAMTLMTNCRSTCLLLRKILKFLNDHFILVAQGIFVAANDVEQNLKFLLARSRYARGKNMFRNDRPSSTNGRSPHRLETRTPIYPTKR